MYKRFLKVALIASAFLFLFGCQKEKRVETGVPAGYNFNYYLAKGNFFLGQKNYDQAIFHLKLALQKNPKSDQANNLLGIAYLMKGNDRKARDQFEKVLDLNPRYVAALCNLAAIYMKKGTAQPASPAAKAGAGLKSKDLEKAEELLRRAIAISPMEASSYFDLASLLILIGKTDEGISVLNKGLDLDPTYLEKSAGKPAAVSMNVQQSPDFYFGYAKFYASRGDVKKALEFLEKARTLGVSLWEKIAGDRTFDQVRNDPEFKEFMDALQKERK